MRKHRAAIGVAAITVVAMTAAGWSVLHHISPCDETLWAHVYHPNRLQDPDPKVHHRCVQATGTIMEVKHEADGDYHMQLRLDPGQETLLAPGNTARQHGYLVLEPVCASPPVTQADAIDPCKGYTSTVHIPKVGDHVKVTGVFVYDAENSQHDWDELHPISSIVAA